MHWTRLAAALARASAGSKSAASMAMIAMTTSSSIRVKARDFGVESRIHFLDKVSFTTAEIDWQQIPAIERPTKIRGRSSPRQKRANSSISQEGSLRED